MPRGSVFASSVASIMSKRVCSDSSTSSSKKHRLSGFDSRWSKDFPFVVYVADRGMFCSVCQKWVRQICNRNGTWITVPCVSLQRDSILNVARLIMIKLLELNKKLFKQDFVEGLPNRLK